MNGIHDMGGMHGFGSVDPTDAESFHADWERRAFGISEAVAATHGVPITLDAFRYAEEVLDPLTYLSLSYYERWLLLAERVCIDAGFMTEEELDLRSVQVSAQSQLAGTEDPRFRDQIVETMQQVRSTSKRRDVDARPRFEVGDPVMTRNVHTTEHTRLPRYLRGRSGTIDALCGAFDLPERAAVGKRAPEHVYSVVFHGTEVWGDSAETNMTIRAQLWESYLSSR
jgi:nitrile hydratase